MAMEIIRKLQREKKVMVAVIVFLLFTLMATHVYYKHKIYTICETTKNISINNGNYDIASDIPQKLTEGKNRKNKR